MKYVKENINERLGFTEDGDPVKDMGIGRLSRKQVIVQHYFETLTDHMNVSIYPYIKDKDLENAFNIKLRDWLNKKITKHKRYSHK